MASISINTNDIKSLEDAKLALQNHATDKSSIDFIDIIIFLRKKMVIEASWSFKSWVQNYKLPQDHYFVLLPVIAQLDAENELRPFLQETRSEIVNAVFEKREITDIPAFISNLGFTKANSKEKLLVLADEIVSHFIIKAYDSNLIELALHLENIYYAEFITKFETDDMFKYGMKKIVESAEKAGQRIDKILNPAGTNEFSDYNNRIPRVGIFFHNASMLAHIDNVFNFLKTLTDRKRLQFTPIIICLGGRNKEFANAFSSIGIEVLYLDSDDTGAPIDNLYHRLLRLREVCTKKQIDKLAWGCLSTFMVFVFSMKVAPEHIWWSQKWTGLSSNAIDKYIYSLTPILEQNLNGNRWLGGWFQRKNWLEQNDIIEEVNAVRSDFGDCIILGSLARTDKMSNERYLAAVVDILKSKDKVVYVWTGRDKDPFIEKFFIDNGVVEKTKFVGWVNTSVYAHVIDVLLDTFPTGNGVTALQAMEAGTPIITMKSIGDVRTWDQFIGPALDEGSFHYKKLAKLFRDSESDENLYLCASNINEYISMANQLIQNKDKQKKVGKAGAEFVKIMMKNPSESADIFQKHILS